MPVMAADTKATLMTSSHACLVLALDLRGGGSANMGFLLG